MALEIQKRTGMNFVRRVVASFAREAAEVASLAESPQAPGDGESFIPQGRYALRQPEKKSPTSPLSGEFEPILNTVKISESQRQTPVPLAVLERAQELLDKGDRGGAYLTLYRELGNEQILIQAQITTYTGIWGSGALTGNNMAREDGGSRYNTQLDEFSVEIAQATIDAVRMDVENGGTGRLSNDQFQTVDRGVWAGKGMAELFPGNIQFFDFWNHPKGDRMAAMFAKSNVNLMISALRSLIPNTALFGLNHDLRNVSHHIGKRPAEFSDHPDYVIHGGDEDRFITVIDNRTGFVEAFWDNKPSCGPLPMPQLRNRPIEVGSPEYRRRHQLYDALGANRHARRPEEAPVSAPARFVQPSPDGKSLWIESY